MRGKNILYLVVFLILIFAATALQPNPEVYWGYVYLEDEPASGSSVLTAETQAGELLSSQILPADQTKPASYSITIEFDDPLTPEDEGAVEGEAIIWKLDNIEVLEPKEDTAEPGKSNNFRISAYANPELEIKAQLKEDEIHLNSQLEADLIIKNIGLGSAKADIYLMDTGSGELTTEEPITLDIKKQTSNSTKLILIPSECKDYTLDIVTSYYNLANKLVDSVKTPISFKSQAHDIALTKLDISNTNPQEGDTVSISITISNAADYDIEGFDLSMYSQDNLIESINSNKTFKADQSTTIQFNLQPELGTSVIKAAVSIDEEECTQNNNELTREIITSPIPILEEELESQTIIHGSEQECIEHQLQLSNQDLEIEMQLCDLIVFNYKGNEYNIKILDKRADALKLHIESEDRSFVALLKDTTQIEENIELSLIELSENPKLKLGLINKEAADSPITSFTTKKTEKITFSTTTILMIIIIFVITILYFRQGATVFPSFQIQKEKTEPIKKELFTKAITPVKPIRKKKPKPIIPKHSVLLSKFKRAIQQHKKIPKADPALSIKDEKIPQVPYEYLSEAVELMGKIRSNLKPRDELIKKYSDRYPKLLINMVARSLFTYSNFKEDIDVVSELEKLKVLDKEYRYINLKKLRLAIDILAKGYASKNSRDYKNFKI